MPPSLPEPRHRCRWYEARAPSGTCLAHAPPPRRTPLARMEDERLCTAHAPGTSTSRAERHGTRVGTRGSRAGPRRYTRPSPKQVRATRAHWDAACMAASPPAYLARSAWHAPRRRSPASQARRAPCRGGASARVECRNHVAPRAKTDGDRALGCL